MFFDPLYLVMIAPALILSIWAKFKVKTAFAKYGKVSTMRGLTGAEAAQQILHSSGLAGIRIEQGRGFLSDHYDPRKKVLRLSPDVYGRSSISAVGVAAHEAGHALQDARDYAPLKLRSALVPAAQIGSNLAWPLLFLGFFLGATGMIKLGVILFSAAVLFQVVTLPVEFNASSRALAALESSGVLSSTEIPGARKVLNAAAMTYVAAAITAVLQLLYFLLRSGLLGGGDD
jgi:Zn-dependent membrane protease YugP